MVSYILSIFTQNTQPRPRKERAEPRSTYTNPLWSQASTDDKPSAARPKDATQNTFCIEYESDESDEDDSQNTELFKEELHDVSLDPDTSSSQKKSMLARLCESISPPKI